jgi:hypothetical protein
MTNEETKDKVAALLEELRACKIEGKTGRVTEIEKSLRALGAEGAPPAKRATKRA